MGVEIIKSDLTVIGAGLSGIFAAISAARLGLKVVLVNDRPVLGGNASSEILVNIMGASHHGCNTSVYAKEGGLIEELRQKKYYYNLKGGYGNYALIDAVLFDMIYDEPNISLYLNTVAYDVILDNDIIKGIQSYQLRSARKLVFESPIYVDSTGDGAVAYSSGAQFRIGRESINEFNEEGAPVKANSCTMGNTLYFDIQDVGRKVEFKRPKFSYDITNMDFMKYLDKPENMRSFGVTGRYWTLEFGGHLDVLKDSEDITLELRKLVFGIWDYVKNSGKYPKADTYIINRVYTISGTRESRRFIGDYILTKNDIEQKKSFEDSIAIGGWPIDDHSSLGIYDPGPAAKVYKVNSAYNIPYRCLYSINISNLFLAGRNISATHLAMASTRVMGTCGCMGQAVGTASYLCNKYNVLPRDITREHIKELQYLLMKDDQTIIGINENFHPDLVNGWKITASSEKVYENVKDEKLLRLDKYYGIVLPILTDYVESFNIKVKNTKRKDSKLKISILTGDYPQTYLAERKVRDLNVIVPGQYDGWINIPVGYKKGKDQKLHVVFEMNQNLSLYYSAERITGAVTFRYYTQDSCEDKNHHSCQLSEQTGFIGCDHLNDINLCFNDIIPFQNIFSPQNILNGFSRPYGVPNVWHSSSKSGEFIELVTEQPKDVGELHILFDTCLDTDILKKMPSMLIRKYKITIANMHGNVLTLLEDNNYLRLNKIKVNMSDVIKIRIDFYDNYGAEYYSLYGLKVFPCCRFSF